MGIFKKATQWFRPPNPSTSSDTLSLCSILDERAASHPDDCPLSINEESFLSYSDWSKNSRSIADRLLLKKVKPGSVIALLFDGMDWVNYAYSYVAVLRAGCTAIHMNSQLGVSETNQRLRECNVAFVIHSSFISVDTLVDWPCSSIDSLLAKTARAITIDVQPAKDADIRYTSGTTGRPKGYHVPHANLVFARTLDTMEQLSNSRSMLVPISIGNSSSATVLTIAITSMNKIILCAGSDIPNIGRIIATHNVHSVMLTPFIASEILEYNLSEVYHLDSVRVLAFASSPLPPEQSNQLLTVFQNAKIQIACAQSEASPALFTSEFDVKRPFSIGRPTPNTEYKIMLHGHPVETGQVGELWLRSSAEKRLYINQPEKNADIMKDGWYRTGDLVRETESGTVELFDRQVDVITVEGKQFSSIHLEARMYEHNNVKTAAVVYSAQSQKNFAYVVLRDTKDFIKTTEELTPILSQLSIPVSLRLISAMPRTPNGKIRKNQLRLLE